MNPQADIRISAGRELYLKSLEPFAYYVANSLFLDGYLNAKGSSRTKTLSLLKDAGFTVKSEFKVDELIDNNLEKEEGSLTFKNLEELRPLKTW